MLSALKNFGVTFLISALVFGVIAYFATLFVSSTVNNILDDESKDLNEIISSEGTAPEETQAPEEHDDPEKTDLLRPQRRSSSRWLWNSTEAAIRIPKRRRKHKRSPDLSRLKPLSTPRDHGRRPRPPL